MPKHPLIIGGGPVGLHYAHMSRTGVVIDRKHEPGADIRCGGLLTNKITSYMKETDVKKILLNKPEMTVVQGPNERFELEQKHNYVIDNSAFEQRLADKAVESGAELRYRTEYIRSNGKTHTLRDMNTKKQYTVDSAELIGADGPHSRVNNVHQVQRPVTMMGWQARVKMKNPGDTITFYPHIGKYAWSIPENQGIMRVGVAGGSKELFDTFLKRFQGRMMDTQHGPIPLHKPFSRTSLTREGVKVRLFGDAAGNIKNTTGGGILPGMEAVSRHLFKQNRVGLNTELYMHFLVHNFLQRFSDREWDSFIRASQRHSEVLTLKTRENLTGIMPRLLGNKEYWRLTLKHFLKGEVPLL